MREVLADAAPDLQYFCYRSGDRRSARRIHELCMEFGHELLGANQERAARWETIVGVIGEHALDSDVRRLGAEAGGLEIVARRRAARVRETVGELIPGDGVGGRYSRTRIDLHLHVG